MTQNQDRPADWIPEDDDPAYQNPIGKLPEAENSTGKPVRQPFDFDPYHMHTESEREELEQEWAEEALPELRTKYMKAIPAVLEQLHVRLDRVTKLEKLTKKQEELDLYRAQYDMWNEAITIWAAEIGLLSRELFTEMANYFEAKYPKEVCKDLLEYMR